jgi:hypothetical protein
MYMKSILTIVIATLAAGSAWAGSQLDSRISTCATTNCAGECLRLDVIQQTADLALLVAAPIPPAIARNSDRDGATDTRPLLMLDELQWTGWYTIIVGFEDIGNTVVRFRLDYGRYPGGNANCVAPAAASVQKFERPAGDPAKVVAPAVDTELDD